MPRIPTYQANLARPNINPVEANPNSAAMPYNAMAQVGETVTQTAQVFGAIIEKRKQQDDITAADKLHNETRFKLDDFLQQNQNSNTLAEDFKKYGESLVSESASSLPSDNAKKIFQSRTMDDVARRYGSALEIGERNRFNNAKIEIQQSSIDATTSYRTLYNLDPNMANESIRKDLDSQLAQIENGFGGIAPANASALKNSVTLDVITGVMESSPETAIELIDEYPIDEQQRRVLRSQAEAKAGARDALGVQRFSQSIEDALAEGQKNGEVAIQPNIQAYKSVFKDESVAQATFEKHKVAFDIHNRALFAISSVRGKSPEDISLQLEKLKQMESGEVGLKVYQAASDEASKLMRERDHDIAGYIRKYNPAIQDLEGKLVGSTPEQAVKIQREIASSILRYQGPPPPPDALGNQPYDKGYYQNLPFHQKKVLTKSQASSLAASFNQGTPDQQVAALASFNASFGEDTKDIAWRDLTSLPKGEAVSQGVQLASLHIGTEVGRQVLSSIQNFDENIKRKGAEISKYNEELNKSESWAYFNSAYAGIGSQNAKSVAGFHDAIVAYAVGLNVKSPREAVQIATDTLLKKKFHYEEVNGELVPFAKWSGPDGRDLSDDEMSFSYRENIGLTGNVVGIVPQVKEAFNNLDFSNVKTTSPDGINLFPEAPYAAGKEKVGQYLNSQLSTEKMLVPSEDGKGFYVYMRNSISRIPTQLFTSDDRPLFIPYFSADKRLNAPQKTTGRIQKLEGMIMSPDGLPAYNPASPFNRQ